MLENSFLVSIPPITLASKRLSSDMRLASHLRKAVFMQYCSQAGQRRHARLWGEVSNARELWFSPAVQLTKHWPSFLYLRCHLSPDSTGASALQLSPRLYRRGDAARTTSLSARSFVPRKAILGFSPVVLLRATGNPPRWRSAFHGWALMQQRSFHSKYIKGMKYFSIPHLITLYNMKNKYVRNWALYLSYWQLQQISPI